MILKMEVKNFRSILSDSIPFEPITVLIGANGSGKSNLVKALELLSDIPRNGLAIAASRRGGAEWIIPKSIPKSRLRHTNAMISYRARLIPPVSPKVRGIRDIEVDHRLEFRFPASHRVRVIREELTFHQILYVAELLASHGKVPDIPPDSCAHPDRQSFFRMFQNEGEKPGFEAQPPIDESNIKHYTKWLGLGFLQEKATSRQDLEKTLDQLWEHRGGRVARGRRGLSAHTDYSFLDPDVTTILDFCSNFNVFRSTDESIKRYDLLLNELRREQQPGKGDELSRSGDNMPTVVRRLSTHAGSSAPWQRLLNTFATISPHISRMRAAALKTGKEFVEFIETRKGRGVESWESSDGSLRALAILLAIETASPGDTVIIEEPEQNLHPWAIRTVVDHIREVVETRDIQVVITTHSEQVLERVHPREVRVATRSEKQGTTFRQLTELIPSDKIAMGDVGRLWVKGLLEGVPSAE